MFYWIVGFLNFLVEADLPVPVRPDPVLPGPANPGLMTRRHLEHGVVEVDDPSLRVPDLFAPDVAKVLELRDR